MNKELQDLAWSVLPKEFKEEVKRRYKNALCINEYAHECVVFRNLFGEHNLTSDADGEDEMLVISRREIQQLVAANDKLIKKHPGRDSIEAIQAKTVSTILNRLFGSKCLPDNVESSRPNVDSLPQNPTKNCDNESHISADCNMPAEPKFKVGDYARYKGDVHKVVATTKDNRCYLNKILVSIDESDLESYTEPTDFGREVNFPTKKQSRNLSQNCDKQFDTILKDSFLKERRLNIATRVLCGMMADPISSNIQGKPTPVIVEWAYEIADALIAEVEKGAEI